MFLYLHKLWSCFCSEHSVITVGERPMFQILSTIMAYAYLPCFTAYCSPLFMSSFNINCLVKSTTITTALYVVSDIVGSHLHKN